MPKEKAEDDLELNHVVLTGRIAADPQRDRTRRGEPITVLLISFPAAEEGSRGSACCEVEVLDEIANPYRKLLRIDSSIMVSGELTGADGIWAKLLAVGEAS